MIPIDCKITNFSAHLFLCFFLKITIIISWCTQLIISAEPVSQCTSYLLIFSPITQHYKWRKNSTTKISTIYNQSNPYENMESSIVKACASFIYFKVTHHWSCCGWWKDTSIDKATLNSEEFQPAGRPAAELETFKISYQLCGRVYGWFEDISLAWKCLTNPA